MENSGREDMDASTLAIILTVVASTVIFFLVLGVLAATLFLSAFIVVLLIGLSRE